MKLKIDDLDTSLQVRYGVDAKAICEYAEAMSAGAKFPDVTVFTDGATYWLSDGFHRVMAAKQNGKATIAADVRKGARIDALRFALKANGTHGVRMSNADKQHALEVAWENRAELFGGEPSAALLADTCGVHRNTAQQFMADQVAQNVQPEVPRQLAQNVQVEAPSAPVRPTRQLAQNVQVERPQMPVRRVGVDGKVRTVPVRPSMPARPVRSVPKDRYGTEIPLEINAAFERGVLADLLSLVSKARVALRKGLEDGLPQFAAVRQDALVNLNNAYNFINAAEPHCVCRMCQGTGCKACHNRGWQTEEEYKRNPKEFQAKGGAK